MKFELSTVVVLLGVVAAAAIDNEFGESLIEAPSARGDCIFSFCYPATAPKGLHEITSANTGISKADCPDLKPVYHSRQVPCGETGGTGYRMTSPPTCKKSCTAYTRGPEHSWTTEHGVVKVGITGFVRAW